MTVEDKLRAAGVTPTIDAAKAFRLGYEAARLDAADGQGKYATIIDRATTHVKP